MENRLTECFELGFYVDKSNIVDISQVAGQYFEKGAYMGKAIDRLGEFEDFMEEQDIPNLQMLKDTLYQANLELYKMQALEDRWKKLKAWVNQKPLRGKSVYLFSETILDKMQELEKENQNAKD